MLEWNDNVERGYFAFQIDEYKDVQSNAHGWLDTSGNSSFSSFGRVSLKLKYDLDKPICGDLMPRVTPSKFFGDLISF